MVNELVQAHQPPFRCGMEKIREVAVFCVGRAVFFGSLAIGCVMVGFSFNPVSAFRSGAMLTLLMAGILVWKAAAAQSQNPKRTEVWLYLDEKTRPPDAHIHFMFATVLREVYARFARIALCFAFGFFAVSVALTAFGLEPYEPPRGPLAAEAP
jgi:hypothetical protein